MAELPLRIAAALLALNGLGFGIPCILGIQNLAAGKGVLIFMGFPTYGGGPFERVGIKSTMPLLGLFLLVSVLELVAAILVWRGTMAGGIMALALLLPGAFFWFGFALPIPPVLATVWTALILSSWRHLH